MQGVELLVREHQNILRFIAYWQDICCKILEGAEVDCALFQDCIDFARNYADKHHHGKEEERLLSQEDKQTVDAMTAELEESEKGRERREKYLAWLDERTRVGV